MLTIGSLAKKTGTKVQTIRYYEQIGLMPEPGRTGGGQLPGFVSGPPTTKYN